ANFINPTYSCQGRLQLFLFNYLLSIYTREETKFKAYI
ncbi:unnamed protein product, partial [marine sediment metagenome]